MRVTSIITWSPDDTEAVYKRFEEFGKGNAPDNVKQAFERINLIAWERLVTNRVVSVMEGDEYDLMMWSGYWQDLADFEIIEPSFDLTDEEVLNKITPPPFLSK